MFMTFKCGSQEDATEIQNLHATDRLGRPNNTSYVACNSCRKKKVGFPFLTITARYRVSKSNTVALASMQPRESGMSSVPTAWHTMCIRCPEESRR
ncbi:predicted protein [Plenodomus lingam JN3]|uniref:Uncharacterized protein n=1 Tax=Leptosphaeria maculans (strain JN3 / isolate v23.1.3 / race Av1-4-5-6-7-8) TaxID=985895 RepID=E5A6T1_LEPMJ|nr:predicted protein [Plenodomus lingam JN3]CBX99326.1 predicted protein [Plenodomus lingam JN3]